MRKNKKKRSSILLRQKVKWRCIDVCDMSLLFTEFHASHSVSPSSSPPILLHAHGISSLSLSLKRDLLSSLSFARCIHLSPLFDGQEGEAATPQLILNFSDHPHRLITLPSRKYLPRRTLSLPSLSLHPSSVSTLCLSSFFGWREI